MYVNRKPSIVTVYARICYVVYLSIKQRLCRLSLENAAYLP